MLTPIGHNKPFATPKARRLTMQSIPITLDFTGIEAQTLGGGAPPEGAYKAIINSVETAGRKSGVGANLIIGYTVAEGPASGQGGRAWFPLPCPEDVEKNRRFFTERLKRLLLAIGVPSNSLGASFSFDFAQAKGRGLVVYVEDGVPGIDGKRSYEFIPVLPEDAAAAIAGQWTPRGGTKAPAAQTPQNGAPAPAVVPPQAQPQGGSFDFGTSFGTSFGGVP